MPGRIFAYAFLTSALLLLFVAGAYAQGGVGSTRGLPSSSGGIHTIQGKVVFPPGTRGEKRAKVTLSSNVAGSNITATDADGGFVFSSLAAASYTITVDAGPNYEPGRENVTIFGTGGFESRVSPQTVGVQVTLRIKGAPDPFAKVSKSARENYGKAMEAVQAGDAKKAIEFLNKAIEAYPEFQPALAERGAMYLKTGELDKAIESLQAALKIDPQDIAVRQNLGVALLNKKDFPGAEKELRAVTAKDDESASAHMYLGLALLYQKKTAEAETELARAISLPGGDKLAQAHKFLGAIYWQKGQAKEAADQLELYVTLSPNAPDADKIRATIKDLRSKQ